MGHYIQEIRIDRLRHLSDITISLNQDQRQHLLITGKNGSGKTSLLLALQAYLCAVNNGDRMFLGGPGNGVKAVFCNCKDLDVVFAQGNFITAFFPANRKAEFLRAQGVEDIRLNRTYDIEQNPGKYLHKYMVHLKTQQAYARNEGDMENVDRIQKWFDRFTDALRVLIDDSSLTLEYDYKEYNFKIHENGRLPFGFDELSDGYSSVIYMVADLILRMEGNWLMTGGFSEYDTEGIVLIDELETHLHMELQKKILPFLVTFFPGIQFIATTHSPYIISSVANVKAYDLENCVELENPSMYSSEELAESYFEVDEYSDRLKAALGRYQELKEKTEPTEAERAERAKLRSELRNIPKGFSLEARDRFEEIEGKSR